MRIEKINIQNNGFDVPGIIINPEKPAGAALIIHGYGGCKEEQPGLAWRIALNDITSCAIDLCGHGENNLPLNDNIVFEANSAVDYLRSFGKVAAIGHSLRGRVALLSNADYAIAISPALNQAFSSATMELIKNLRSYRVRESSGDNIFKLLNKIPVHQFNSNKPAAVIYGERDIPEIKKACMELKLDSADLIEIKQAFHGDIFLLEETFTSINKFLKNIKIFNID